jgi:hypothetical protein
MKNIKLSIAVVLGLFCLTALNSVRAQMVVPVTLTLTTTYEGNSSDDGTATTILPNEVYKLTTKSLLYYLAQDEYVAGHYPTNSFPVGAKLAIVDGTFFVVNSTNGLILDVSNILTLKMGKGSLFSGKFSDLTDLASPTGGNKQMVAITYDNTQISGVDDWEFSMKGVLTSKFTDGPLDTINNKFYESASYTISGLVGDGYDVGYYFIVTGSAKGAGKGLVNY